MDRNTALLKSFHEQPNATCTLEAETEMGGSGQNEAGGVWEDFHVLHGAGPCVSGNAAASNHVSLKLCAKALGCIPVVPCLAPHLLPLSLPPALAHGTVLARLALPTSCTSADSGTRYARCFLIARGTLASHGTVLGFL
jgi:hypothetical protein